MRMRWWLVGLICWCAVQGVASPITWKIRVDGVERSALIYPGKKADVIPSPVVFAFHGFSGVPQDMAGWSRLHEAWPEATVVYPLGLRVMSKRLHRKVPAWQAAPGRDDDRDVRFVDALLDDLRRSYRVDNRRIYATGISNGAMMTYVLFTLRPEVFAAFAPIAGKADFVSTATVPRPVMIVQGKADTTVLPEWSAYARDQIRRINGCGDREVEWAPGYVTYQPCASGQPVVWRLHNGGHIYPPRTTEFIVRFFRQHALPAA
ncbi:MAG: CE1 family esterase [Armatimonadota bacterium]